MSGEFKGEVAPNQVDTDTADTADLRSREVQALFQSEIDLVQVIAKQILRTIDGAVQLDELVSAGLEGLFDAARRFDPTRGIPFRAYANYRVEGAIVDAVRHTLRLPRRAHERLAMYHAASNVNQGEHEATLSATNGWYADMDPEERLNGQLATIVLSAMMSEGGSTGGEGASNDGQPTNPEEAYERAELMAMVRSAVAELKGYEARAISLYYFEGKTHEEAAEAMKVAKSWAHRLHTRALERLTKQLRLAIRD